MISMQLVLAGSSFDPLSKQNDNSSPMWLPLILVISLLCAGAWVINNQINGKKSETKLEEIPSWKEQKGIKKSETDSEWFDNA